MLREPPNASTFIEPEEEEEVEVAIIAKSDSQSNMASITSKRRPKGNVG
jgi:hypothetical protein